MSDPKPDTEAPAEDGFSRYRRNFLAGIAKAGMAGGGLASGAAVVQGAWGGSTQGMKSALRRAYMPGSIGWSIGPPFSTQS